MPEREWRKHLQPTCRALAPVPNVAVETLIWLYPLKFKQPLSTSSTSPTSCATHAVGNELQRRHAGSQAVDGISIVSSRGQCSLVLSVTLWMAEPATAAQLDLRRSRVALLLAGCLVLVFVLHHVHVIDGSARRGLCSASASIRSHGIHRTRPPSMSGSQHAVPAINAIVNDEEVVVLWELVLVYAMHTALRRSAAKTIASWDKAGVLHLVSQGPTMTLREVHLGTYTLTALMLTARYDTRQGRN